MVAPEIRILDALDGIRREANGLMRDSSASPRSHRRAQAILELVAEIEQAEDEWEANTINVCGQAILALKERG